MSTEVKFILKCKHNEFGQFKANSLSLRSFSSLESYGFLFVYFLLCDWNRWVEILRANFACTRVLGCTCSEVSRKLKNVTIVKITFMLCVKYSILKWVMHPQLWYTVSWVQIFKSSDTFRNLNYFRIIYELFWRKLYNDVQSRISKYILDMN